MKVQVIMPTAGRGKRFGADRPKALVLLHKKPVFIHTLNVFERHPAVHSIVLVGPSDHLAGISRWIKKFRLKKVAALVPGGKTRQQSVFNGLQFLDEDTGAVIVHDGVRPLVSAAVVNRCLAALKRTGAVIAAVPVKPTIKEVNPKRTRVRRTIRREALVEVQTPQVFRRDLLEKAHKKFFRRDVTDDAMLAELLKVRVGVVDGDYRNIKITTPEDLLIAAAFLKKMKGKSR